MINLQLTPQIQQYLDTPPQNRDIIAGAKLLLKINRNRILYNNILRNPARHADTLEYQLKKILKKRLIDTTHEQVKQMMHKVDTIAQQHGITRHKRTDFQRGKRQDHDQLPPEVQKLYTDNADIRHRLRDAHTRLRLINSSNSTCPDSDRYPIAKDIIRLDRLYRHNWNLYDHYIKGTELTDTITESDPRTERKNAVKTLNLIIGKYNKNHSDKLAARIRDLYNKIDNPPESLKTKIHPILNS